MKTFGPYEIVRTLGSGGFARTCEARHVLLGVKACLKVSLRAEDDELLLREARVLAALRHPSLPALREVFEHPGGGLVLAMSFAEGETLDETRPLTAIEACRVGGKVLRALAYLHKGGVVHGDVKPRNIVVESLERGGDVVLVDLGLAAVRPVARTKAIGWTEAFAAPEVRAGKPPLPESDLYALAKTLDARLAAPPPARLAEWLEALTEREPARRPRWETKDPLRWLERIRRSLERTATPKHDPRHERKVSHV
ncbi:MAG: serine/threonine-protein kinase [Planctomycetota bacterium]